MPNDTLDEAAAATMLRDFVPRGRRAARAWPHTRGCPEFRGTSVAAR